MIRAPTGSVQRENHRLYPFLFKSYKTFAQVAYFLKSIIDTFSRMICARRNQLDSKHHIGHMTSPTTDLTAHLDSLSDTESE